MQIKNFLLNPDKYPNISPVVLAYSNDNKISGNLKNVIEKESLVPPYIYTTTSKGERLTLPNVESNNKIIMVGDSLVFGVGVNDFDTSASYLQKFVSNDFQVINLGVGGYTAKQSFDVANNSDYINKNNILVWLIQENDFFKDGDFYVN